MARSLAECSSSFFRYHYTKGADAAAGAAAASLSVTLREATKRRPFASSIPPRAEWSQNNLLFIGDIRSHSNPGNRFFSLPPPAFASFSTTSLRGFSVFRSSHNYFHSLASSCKQYSPARVHVRANRCTESRNLVETCRSRRERDVGVIVRLNAGKSAECFGRSATDDWAPFSSKFTNRVTLDRKEPKG